MMSEFLAMGGYAWYVWMSYGAVALVVVLETLAVHARRRRAVALARTTAIAPATPTPRFDPAQGT
jgi:heme exporter protein D